MAERRVRRVLLVAALVVAAPVLGSCGDGADEASAGIALDGSPRVPDAEGIVVALADDFSTLTLDGDRTFTIPEDVQSFSTVDGSTQPLKRRVGQYVHLGLEGKTVEWVAGIAAVVDDGSGQRRVFYRGEVREVVDDRLEFADGTVLRLAAGSGAGATEAKGQQVLATIDPEKRVVVALVPQ